MAPKKFELPAEAVRLPDGRYFVPLKPRSQPKPKESPNPNAIPLTEFYDLDPLPKDSPDQVPLFRPLKGNRGNPASMPSEAPPLTVLTGA